MDAEIQAFLVSLETQPDYSLNTRLAYRSDLNYFLDYLRGILKRPPTLADFDAQQVAGFLEAERQSGRRQSTLLRRRATLRRFEIFLVQEGLIKNSPSVAGAPVVDRVVSPTVPKEPLLYLTGEEINRLWNCMEEEQRPLARRDHAILAVLLEIGMSVSMLVALDLTDLDTHGEKIHLKDASGQDVWLPLNKASGPVNRYLKDGRPELNGSPDEPALFISQVGTRMSRQSVWQVLRHWGEAARLPVTLSPRLVRHTAAMRLLQSGRPSAEIQVLLGHTNPLSTQALINRLKTATSSG
jgi:integrase/recombinase XerD